jgi:hypothetical protein
MKFLKLIVFALNYIVYSGIEAKASVDATMLPSLRYNTYTLLQGGRS